MRRYLGLLEIGSYAAVLLALLMTLFGCNAAKKVMRNREDFDKVGEAWSKDHPCANDTVTSFAKGDTVTLFTGFNLDTTYTTQTLTDTVTRTIVQTRTITKIVKDTLIKNVTDVRALTVSQKEQSRLRDSLTQTTIASNNFKASRNSWRGIVYAIVGLVCIVGVGLFFFFTYFKKSTLAHNTLSKQAA